jgi:4-hydroxy-tetrahydrodipicolinate synthase
LRGVYNVILPTFTSDLKRLNGKGIRHDGQEEIKNGFAGPLVVSECGTTLPELKQFMEVCLDEAKGGMHFLVPASTNTREESVELAKHGEQVGAHALLLAYPTLFRPKSERDICDTTKAVCDSTHLGVILFTANLMSLSPLPRQ